MVLDKLKSPKLQLPAVILTGLMVTSALADNTKENIAEVIKPSIPVDDLCQLQVEGPRCNPTRMAEERKPATFVTINGKTYSLLDSENIRAATVALLEKEF